MYKPLSTGQVYDRRLFLRRSTELIVVAAVTLSLPGISMAEPLKPRTIDDLTKVHYAVVGDQGQYSRIVGIQDIDEDFKHETVFGLTIGNPMNIPGSGIHIAAQTHQFKKAADKYQSDFNRDGDLDEKEAYHFILSFIGELADPGNANVHIYSGKPNKTIDSKVNKSLRIDGPVDLEISDRVALGRGIQSLYTKIVVQDERESPLFDILYSLVESIKDGGSVGGGSGGEGSGGEGGGGGSGSGSGGGGK